MLYILVDYDNLERQDRERGIRYVVERMLDLLEDTDVNDETNVNIRLYGGWYVHGNISVQAQKLISQIGSVFPRKWSSVKYSFKLTVSVDLAYSLLISPAEHLHHTFRKRKYTNDLVCVHPHDRGCFEQECTLIHLYNGIRNQKCVTLDCDIKLEDILEKNEQKLIDTMLSSDVFFLSNNKQNPIVIVSSDDDFWPCIRTALQLGRKVIHIHTKINITSTSPVYSQYANKNYFQRHM